MPAATSVAASLEQGAPLPASRETRAEAWRKALVSVQNELGAPGDAPVASNDTAAADRHRQVYVDSAWPPRRDESRKAR